MTDRQHADHALRECLKRSLRPDDPAGSAPAADDAPWVADPEDGRMVCKACGYNQPFHERRCAERGLTELQLRCEFANLSDAMVDDLCVRCGYRIGYAGAVIDGNGLAHKRCPYEEK